VPSTDATSPERPRSAKTDPAALRAMVDEDRKARKGPRRDVDHVEEVDDDVEFLQARLVGPSRPRSQAGTAPSSDQTNTQTPEQEERVDTPFGPVEGFGDFDFVPTTPPRKGKGSFSEEDVGRRGD
jgi:hypothetical protein